jgi:glycosyltransferase 2 family protein
MKRIATYISWVLVAASLVFIVYAITRMDLRPLLKLARPVWGLYLVALSVVYASINILRGLNWALILALLENRAPRWVAAQAIYLRTEIAKYIPSNIMHFAGRHLFARKLGCSDAALVLSNVLDMGLLLFVAAVIVAISLAGGFITLPSAIYAMISYKKLAFMAGAGILVFLFVFVLKFRSLEARYRTHLRARSVGLLALVIALFLPVFVFSSLILLAIIGPMLGAPLSAASAGFIFAGFTLSWTIGFIVPGAPGGLGIRETVMMLLFTPVFGPEIALAAALLLRVVSIAGDGLSFAASYLPVYRRQVPSLDRAGADKGGRREDE